MKILNSVVVLILIFSFCENRRIEKSSIFDDMDNLISQDPEHAIKLLDSYNVSPKDLYSYNLYRLYSIKAKDQLEISIRNDLEIINSYNYFKEIGDEYLGLAAYYSGKVLQQSKTFDKAMDYYNLAESFAVAKNDLDFRGLILHSKGELMLEQLLHEKAKSKFSEAIIIFKKTGNYKSEIKSLNRLAITFLLDSKFDSAVHYYDKAYILANIHYEKKESAYATKDKGLVYYAKGDYKTAIKLAQNAKQIDSVIIKSGKADLLISSAYLGLNRSDSAKYYVNNAILNLEKDSSDFKNYVSAYLLLSEIAESEKDYFGALNNYKLYMDNFEEIISNEQINAIIDAERKYKLEVVENQINKLTITKLRTERFIFIFIFIVLIIAIFYSRLIIRKNKALSNATDEILKLTEYLTEQDKTQESISDYYNHYFNVLKRAASLEYLVQDSEDKQGKSLIKKFNEIAYGQYNIDWDILYKIINKLHEDKLDKIKEKYLELDEIEFRICCLLCSKMSSNEIAVIVQLKVATLHMKTTNIRKKLGIEKYGNVADFLYNNL